MSLNLYGTISGMCLTFINSVLFLYTHFDINVLAATVGILVTIMSNFRLMLLFFYDLLLVGTAQNRTELKQILKEWRDDLRPKKNNNNENP